MKIKTIRREKESRKYGKIIYIQNIIQKNKLKE